MEYWRAVIAPCAKVSRAQPATKALPQVKLLDWDLLESNGVNAKPLHVVVSDAASRTKSKRVVSHVWLGFTRAASFVRVDKGIYVSSPEACFLQLAPKLSLVDLVKLGIELCGVYTQSLSSGRGFVRKDPLTSVTSIQKYLAKMEGIPGCKKAQKALGYLVEGSASPMETMLVMFLCLPTFMGGYGLKLPQCNCTIDVSSTLDRGDRGAYYCCDLYWSDKRVAVEYDSDMFHTGSKRIAKDSRRRNDLLACGVKVVSVTRGQVFNARELDSVARALAKLLKIRLRSERQDLLTRRFALRQQLIGAMQL